MNLQQLEYVIALDETRHFVKAAEKCFVTQPTLSMMIRKFEEELGMPIFDRSIQPVVPTTEGVEIIARCKRIMAEVQLLKQYTRELKDEIVGRVHIGIIPTLAPYLLPLFLKPFLSENPGLTLYVKEMITEEIVQNLKTGDLDIGILATPLGDNYLEEHVLFNEEFFVYASKSEKLPKKKYLLPKEIDISHLWLLEEGHCMRNQIFNLCELKNSEKFQETFHYEAGSIESLINLVDSYQGITIIPSLAVGTLKPVQKSRIREFAKPKPAREISVVTVKSFPRKKLLGQLLKTIRKQIPDSHISGRSNVLDIRMSS